MLPWGFGTRGSDAGGPRRETPRLETIRNETAQPLLVFFEPWGVEHWLLPGDVCEVHATAPGPSNPLAISVMGDGLTVWAEGPVRTFEVRINGVAVSHGEQRPGGWR